MFLGLGLQSISL